MMMNEGGNQRLPESGNECVGGEPSTASLSIPLVDRVLFFISFECYGLFVC